MAKKEYLKTGFEEKNVLNGSIYGASEFTRKYFWPNP